MDDDRPSRFTLLQRRVAELEARLAELEQENKDLRKYLATSAADCPYCGLPAADMAKCARGFPGCGRADDMG